MIITDSTNDIKADVCIVGAGAAGLVLASELLKNTDLGVALIEAGDLLTVAAPKGFSPAKVSAPENFGAEYLKTSRLQGFGGTTNHWGGWCRPLSESTFKNRDWIPESGWPFDFSVMKPFYLRAANYLEIETPPGASVEKNILKKSSKFNLDFFNFSALNFKDRFLPEIKDHPRAQLLLNTPLLKINSSEGKVTHLTCGRRQREIKITAKTFVLACGGIENARQLLISGIGNNHGLVGKYFMEHPHCSAGSIEGPGESKEFDIFFRSDFFITTKNRSQALWVTSEKFQKQHKVLEVSCSLTHAPAHDVAAAESITNILNPNLKRAPSRFTVFTRQEQLPEISNSITLSDKKDELGLPLINFNYSLSKLDFESLKTTLIHLGIELGKVSKWRLKLNFSDKTSWQKNVIGGCHHMGTTRMHKNPVKGVVDANAKVHESANLYIAGSSLFPTGGSSNPTLTLLALAVKLADHIKSQ